MEAFFAEDGFESKSPESIYPKCESCKLYKSCHSPKMPVDGEGRRSILILGEGPGQAEDDRGRPFVGKTGKYLEKACARVGLDMRRDCWLTNACICRPQTRGINRTPTDREIGYCRPNLTNTLKRLQPIVIITMGGTALKSVIKGIWRDQLGGVTRWLGWQIPSQTYNTWICPTWHPSYITRAEDQPDGKMLEMLFEKHLKAAMKLSKSRPWALIPDYASQVKVILNPEEAAEAIHDMDNKDLVAFDYETTCLKPEANGAEIVCCSISSGDCTIAFPWTPLTRKVMGCLLNSPTRKICSNIKFEERWTRKEYGFGVRGWDWDTMLAAHWLDNRQGITSIKFQAFVKLGFPIYDEHIHPYLKAKGGNVLNHIQELSWSPLLQYCGLDSFLEWQVANIQKGIMTHNGSKQKGTH